jgi:hypothetical protein
MDTWWKGYRAMQRIVPTELRMVEFFVIAVSGFMGVDACDLW